MPSLTLKNLPEELHQRLVEVAARNRRSLNREIVECLRAMVMASRVDPEDLILRARELRRHVAGRLPAGAITKFKRLGRK